jgi:glutathione S-transferase
MYQLKIPFERVTIDTQSNQTRTPEFLLINPNGKVPALSLKDGNILTESNAMLWFLAENTQFLPQARFERAQVLQWMFFEQYSHEPFIATLRNWISYAKTRKRFHREIEAYRPKGYAALNVMEKHLESRTFFVGETYSIADIALYAYTHVAHEGEYDLSSYVAVRKWLGRIKKQSRHIPITW